MSGGTLMRQGPHKAVGYVCLEKSLAGVPGLGWHGGSWGLVWPHSSHMEWKAEGWEENGASIVNYCLYFFLSLVGWRKWWKVALHHKAGGNKGNSLYTKPHKHNQQIGVLYFCWAWQVPEEVVAKVLHLV